tara:strand:- start:1370 stop:1636 length:267 start_codon:yes stop_codon:yes gene_type:complete
MEIEGLVGIIDSDYRDGNHPVGMDVWTWSANPFDRKNTFSGIISSLSKKGFVYSYEDGEESTLHITEAGWLALSEVKSDYCKSFGDRN